MTKAELAEYRALLIAQSAMQNEKSRGLLGKLQEFVQQRRRPPQGGAEGGAPAMPQIDGGEAFSAGLGEQASQTSQTSQTSQASQAASGLWDVQAVWEPPVRTLAEHLADDLEIPTVAADPAPPAPRSEFGRRPDDPLDLDNPLPPNDSAMDEPFELHEGLRVEFEVAAPPAARVMTEKPSAMAAAADENLAEAPLSTLAERPAPDLNPEPSFPPPGWSAEDQLSRAEEDRYVSMVFAKLGIGLSDLPEEADEPSAQNLEAAPPASLAETPAAGAAEDAVPEPEAQPAVEPARGFDPVEDLSEAEQDRYVASLIAKLGAITGEPPAVAPEAAPTGAAALIQDLETAVAAVDWSEEPSEASVQAAARKPAARKSAVRRPSGDARALLRRLEAALTAERDHLERLQMRKAA